jgi:hypothetical protein
VKSPILAHSPGLGAVLDPVPKHRAALVERLSSVEACETRFEEEVCPRYQFCESPGKDGYAFACSARLELNGNCWTTKVRTLVDEHTTIADFTPPAPTLGDRR